MDTKKKIYLYICFLINLFSWIAFIYQDHSNKYIPISCLLFISISVSFTSVITSAIQVEISKLQDKQNTISKEASDLMANFFIIKTIGNLVSSYLKGVLIEKYFYNIIFYLSAIFSGFILISGIILDDKKIIRKIKTKRSFPHLIDSKKREIIKFKLTNLIKNKNILILFLLIFILESSPSCVSPLFFYETNILRLNPKKLGLIDFISQISIIVFIYFYRYFLNKFNFRFIIFITRILIFANFSLIYLLIKKITQKYISDFIVLAFAYSLNAGWNSLSKFPYSLLCIKYSQFGLEATTFAFSVSFNFLGKIFGDFIDYRLTLYYKITHYNFSNLGRLIFVENIIHLIPLIYILIIPRRFFATIKRKNRNIELEKINEEGNENKKKSQNNNENNEVEDADNNEVIADNNVEYYIEDDEDENNLDDEINLNLKNNQNSYRYLFF